MRTSRRAAASVLAWVLVWVLCSSWLSPSLAFAQPVQVNFSGGGGSPLTITLPQPVSFTVTKNAPTLNPVLVIQDCGGPVVTQGLAVGPMSYTINAGAAHTVNRISTTALGPALDGNDLALYEAFVNPAVNLNDVVIFSGSTTTAFSVAVPAPPSGLYSAIIADGNFVPLVPEPSGLVLLAPAAIFASRRRRRGPGGR